jgi:MFS family permease
MFKGISKTVWVLSIISLCTDAASEMLYPVMPVYLKSIGFSIVFIGLLEGIAEAIAGLSKGYFGKLSDVSGKRVPFVQLGYTLSAISKPMLAFFINPIWVFFSRTTDRLGKGIRTGARDALLSDEATPETKGKIFGFHRSMDTLGAVIGPAIALIYLYFNPSQYKTLFLLAFIPGLLAILSTLFLKQKNNPAPKEKQKVSFFSFLNYWKQSDIRYRKLVIGLLIFALFNSSDVFLLLKVKEAGINDTYVIGIYIFYNLIYSLSAFPMGILADKLGMKKIFITGLVIFSIVYAGMGITTELWWFVILFLLYGIYAAATEGIAKAWISNISDKKDTATAIGTYTGFQSICSLLASTISGLIWFEYGSTTAFLTIAIISLIVFIYFFFLHKD